MRKVSIPTLCLILTYIWIINANIASDNSKYEDISNQVLNNYKADKIIQNKD